jgi:aryl-alcohol dehydrogenase-like predicted oxidoreductase
MRSPSACQSIWKRGRGAMTRLEYNRETHTATCRACHVDKGGLTGRITAGATFPEGDFRGDRPAQVEQRVAAIVADLGIAPDEIAETALRFVLSAPAVSTVIPGMRTVRNVERNTAIGDGRLLTTDQLAVVAEHRWQRNFYG